MAFKMKYGKGGFPFKQKDSWVVKANKLGKTEDGFNVADKDKNYSVSKEEYETYIKENNSSDPFKQTKFGKLIAIPGEVKIGDPVHKELIPVEKEFIPKDIGEPEMKKKFIFD